MNIIDIKNIKTYISMRLTIPRHVGWCSVQFEWEVVSVERKGHIQNAIHLFIIKHQRL